MYKVNLSISEYIADNPYNDNCTAVTVRYYSEAECFDVTAVKSIGTDQVALLHEKKKVCLSDLNKQTISLSSKDTPVKTEYITRSLRRSKQNIRRKALCLEADRMLTLTFQENIQDLKQAYYAFSLFIKRMRYQFGNRFQYVEVYEKQKRGAYHFHVAYKGYYYWETLLQFWRESVEAAGIAGLGGINMRYQPKKQKGRKGTWQVSKLASYISKYISKDLKKIEQLAANQTSEETQSLINDLYQKNVKRYTTSRNIPKEKKIVFYTQFTDFLNVRYLISQVIKEIKEQASLSYTCPFLDWAMRPSEYYFYECNTT